MTLRGESSFVSFSFISFWIPKPYNVALTRVFDCKTQACHQGTKLKSLMLLGLGSLVHTGFRVET